MPNYTDHDAVLKLLTDCQDADQDNRTRALEAQWFVEKIDGQWEPEWWDANNGKPRYTFDMTGPIVDQVAGEIEQADFDIKIKPAGGDSTKETARVLDGIVRNIETISNASAVYTHAARNMVCSGLDGWRVVQEFVDGDSFDQDLIIKPIYNFTERVWFDIGSQTRDRSDSRYCFVLQAIPKEDYEERFPDGSGQGVSSDRTKSAYYNKADTITIGQIYYVKMEERELALMSNGEVIELNDDSKSVLDELAAQGITVEKTRKRKKPCVYSRLFDGEDFLTKPQKTVFSYIPVIPTYGNFKVIEEKTVYRGVVQKLIDPQRVMNYSMSREIEEGALAPRAKYWMTPKQALGHENKLKSMNTNSDPVQFYNADPEAPGAPQQNGGAQVNPGLRTISESMRQLMGQTAGMFAANMGDNPGLQSGIAIERLQNKGDTGTIKYFKAQEIAICHTARIIIDAIPKVYDTARKIRILKEDGSFDIAAVNQVVIDQQTGRQVVVNDLSKGKYDVTCSAGPAFQNRMQETVSTIMEMAQYDPSTLQTSGDILFQNMNAPGMDLIAERKRQQLFSAGMIPPAQLTDEERAIQQQAASQPKQDGPAEVIAQAEMGKAQAEMTIAQNKVKESESSLNVKALELQMAQRKLEQADEKQDDTVAIEQMKMQHETALTRMKLVADAQTKITLEAMKKANEPTEAPEPQIDIDAVVGQIAMAIDGVAQAAMADRAAIVDPETGRIIGSQVVPPDGMMN